MTSPMRIDVVTRVAPLGLAFVDQATGKRVTDHLECTAILEADLRLRRPSRINASGVHWFAGLPGLAEFERGSGDAQFWAQPMPSVPLVIEVQDRARRFLPFSFRITAPQRGLAQGPGGVASPPEPAAVPLFSAPNRPAPAGFAALRATLKDAENGQPAAHAALELSAAGLAPVRGIADRNGQVAIVFPYPPPVAGFHGSPMSGMEGSLSSQSWELEVGVFYGRLAAADFPDLESILDQPAGGLWASYPADPLVSAQLRFGEEAVLRSSNTVSEVLISPGGSPPPSP